MAATTKSARLADFNVNISVLPIYFFATFLATTISFSTANTPNTSRALTSAICLSASLSTTP